MGKQNLKFSIENYVESIQKKEKNFYNYIFETNINKEKNNQNELINNEDEHNETLWLVLIIFELRLKLLIELDE